MTNIKSSNHNTTLTPDAIVKFQQKILDWYAKHQRDLPWRKSRDPYRILVSEVMLQQTQVSRVIPKFNAWFEAFPTIEHLASAQTSEVLRFWSGLGYNRRALFLQKTAKAVVFDHSGEWPQTIEALKQLPGIGEYTAAAIACFAFDEQVAVIDTNVKKVILVELYSSAKVSEMNEVNAKELQQIAAQLLPHGKAYDWNQALMDYASAVLKQEKIPIPKQSKFHGSRRYYRGKILKLLLEKQSLSIPDLAIQLHDANSSIDQATLGHIVKKLERDGFIKKKKEKVSLA